MKTTGRLALMMVVAGMQLVSLDRARADLTCVDLFYKSPFVNVRDSDALRLQNKDGSIAVFPAKSYYRETQFREIVDFVLSRPADTQARIDDALTDGHARNGNTFQKKNPKTGHYDQEFAPRVNGAVIPLEKAFFDEQVESMAPVARSLRFLLQRIYSSGDMFIRYKSGDARQKREAFTEIVSYLEISALPALEQGRLVDIVAESIYLEPAMIDPALKDYGFLPVIGFDAAIDTLQKVTAIYYEFNSGTPSGLSNNIQLLELIRQKDPALFAKFKDQILDDKTFEYLHDAISSNARAFTGQVDGISVIIGPGSFNGAHPDVSAISVFSGMPLVKSEDLYVGRDGFVYLNTGSNGKHPKVTGIYGRIEESAFLNSAKDGIGWITPELKDNEELGRKWGVALRNGVNYEWKTNEKGEKVGVALDEAGRPVVSQYFLGQIGRDPSRPNERATESFAQLIKGRKLYFSGLGGRVIDDKRVFEIINRHLAARFKTPGKEKTPAAGPPRTLTANEIHEFYAHPEKFVVKVPDESGGAGVYLGPLLSRQELLAVVEKVKKDRADAARTGQQPVLTIQDFTTASVMTVPTMEETKRMVWGTTVPDWRFFILMNDKGRVRAGENSFLIRAAQRLSPSTNTSQGAGYGVGVILDSKARRTRDARRSVLPARRTSLPLSASSRLALTHYFDELHEIVEIANSGSGAEAKLREVAPENPYNLGNFNPNMKWNRLEILVQRHKEVIAELGLESSQFMTVLKAFNSGRMTFDKFRTAAARYQKVLAEKTDYQHAGVHELVVAVGNPAKAKLRPSLHSYFRSKNVKAFAPVELEAFLRDHVTLEKSEPTVLRETNWFGTPVEIVRVGRVLKTTDARMNRLIDEITAAGGEIRYVRQRGKDGKFLEAPPAAEFGVSPDGRPMIDIDLNQSQLLAGVAHEMVHFRDWLAFYGAEIKSGKSPSEAGRVAVEKIVGDIAFQRDGEVRAVEAELQIESTVEPGVFNSGRQMRPTKFWQSVDGFSFASRVLYPDVVAVGRVLGKIRWASHETPGEETRSQMAELGRKRAEKYLTNLILGAESYRAKSVAYLESVHAKYSDHPNAAVRRRATEALAESQRVARTSLFDYVIRNVDLGPFSAADTLDLLRNAYQAQVDVLVKSGRLAEQVELPEILGVGASISSQQQQQQ